MSPRRALALVDGRRRVGPAGELCVVVGCHQLACVLPARWIERLVLADEVASIAGQRPEPGTPPPLVLVGEKAYAAWNLGELLGLAPVGAAWVLLRVPHRGESLPIALHSGPCLIVQPLVPGLALPVNAFRERPGAIAGVLAAAAVHGRVAGEVALWLDPAQLWREDELDRTAVALRQAARQA